MGGSSNEIDETESEKALAGVLRQETNYYDEYLRPLEQQAIADAHKTNDASVYDGVSGSVNLGYQQKFGQQGQSLTQNLSASGVDPSSGKFKGKLNTLSSIQASGQAEATARGDADVQQRHIASLSNVMARGQGKAQQAVSSLSDIAGNSQRAAMSDAMTASSTRNSMTGSLAALGGAYTRSTMNGGSGSETAPITLGANNYDPNTRVV